MHIEMTKSQFHLSVIQICLIKYPSFLDPLPNVLVRASYFQHLTVQYFFLLVILCAGNVF